jgi:hypothetical protein
MISVVLATLVVCLFKNKKNNFLKWPTEKREKKIKNKKNKRAVFMCSV